MFYFWYSEKIDAIDRYNSRKKKYHDGYYHKYINGKRFNRVTKMDEPEEGFEHVHTGTLADGYRRIEMKAPSINPVEKIVGRKIFRNE